LGSGGDKLLRLSALSIPSPGKLDLNDNDMIVDYAGARSPTLSAIESLIASARNFGAWNGSGLTSTAAKSNQQANTTLGAIEASDYKNVTGGTTFDGETIDNSAVLVKYTYY